MHSSRMHTGWMLTVFRWRTPPPRKFGGTPPEKLETHPHLRDQTRENWRHPPRKFGGTPPGTRHPPPCEQNDRRLWKYYLGQNFVSAGNEQWTRLWDEHLFVKWIIVNTWVLPISKSVIVSVGEMKLNFQELSQFTFYRQGLFKMTDTCYSV